MAAPVRPPRVVAERWAACWSGVVTCGWARGGSERGVGYQADRGRSRGRWRGKDDEYRVSWREGRRAQNGVWVAIKRRLSASGLAVGVQDTFMMSDNLEVVNSYHERSLLDRWSWAIAECRSNVHW